MDIRPHVSQTVLDAVFEQAHVLSPPPTIAAKAQSLLLKDSGLIPLYAVGLSISLLLVHLIIRIPAIQRRISRIRGWEYIPKEESSRAAQSTSPTATFQDELRDHVAAHGGLTIFLANALRLATCLTLLALTIYSTVVTPGPVRRTSPLSAPAESEVEYETEKKWKKPGEGRKHKHKYQRGGELFSYEEWVEIALCAFYTYASLLALTTLVSRRKATSVASEHLRSLLLVAFCVFAYRDLLPLGTFTKNPVDAAGGWLTWVRVGLLTFVGFLLPIIVPKKFIPVDPANPLSANPEQTASILSYISFSFLDSVVYKASHVAHLPYDELPVLADYDHADYLVKTAWPVLDPTQKLVKNTHIFWGLMWIHRWDYAIVSIVIVFEAITTLLGPFTLNHLLRYMETGGRGAIVRPWVWIFSLFLSSFAPSICMHIYIFHTTRLLVRAECRLTQLIFEHALRVRMKETPSTPASNANSEPTTAVRTRSASLVGLSPEREAQLSGWSDGAATTVRGSESEGQGLAKKDTSKDSLPITLVAPAVSSFTEPKEKEAGSNLIGKITNLASTDMGNVVEGRDFVLFVLMAPLKIGLSMWFLYSILGWSAIIGLLTIVLSLPVPGKLAQKLNQVQSERMKKTDARVQAVTDTLSVIRMIKLFGWETRVKSQVDEKREEELKYIKTRSLLSILNMNVNHFLPLFTMIVTFATYTLVQKQQLTASRIFSSIAVFEVIRDQLHLASWELGLAVTAKVSMDRINDFLNHTELLDRFTERTDGSIADSLPATADSSVIGFRNASFSWNSDSPDSPGGTITPSRRNFHLRIEGDLFFKPGKLNVIIGPTGCGKTSLLMALLGEMHFKAIIVDSFFNLPRENGIAYAAQEAWIQNATIKENILFGAELDEQRYTEVIRQCSLERDLTLFEAGDATEIGEKGVTLSGGQKARVSLARALYSSAHIILLDDVLSALDVHTSRWIVDKCLCGDLIQGRTVLLVTHNIAMVSSIADFIVTLSRDGSISSQGSSVTDALKRDPKLLAEVVETTDIAMEEEKAEDLDETTKPKADKPKGQLIAKEEILEGRVGWEAFKFFFGSFGGTGFWITFTLALFLAQMFEVAQTWFLGYWAAQYSKPYEVHAPWYLGMYALLIVGSMSFYNPGYVLYIFGSVRGSRTIHRKLMRAVLGTSLRWLDSTPTGRIISRFTQDMRGIDGPVPGMFGDLVEMAISMLLKFVAVLVYSPIFLLPGIAVSGFGAWLGRVYIQAQLAVKREMSNAKSPVYSHFGAAIAGLTSIRAYGAEAAFVTESKKRIDHYSRPARTYWNLNRWISVRVDLLGAIFSAALAAYLVYGKKVDSSTTGFSLSMAMAFTGMLLWAVRLTNEFEVQGNSLERIRGYVDIEQEPAPTEAGKPPAYWPASGSLRVEKLCARYSIDGPDVLHDISFEIQSGEHVGVVGRTGAGKSSLSLALLRMIPTTGSVFLDGLDISNVNLDALRNSITIIPQQPELMSGTLRQNLDPFGGYDDATLNACLRSAGLFNLQNDDDEDKIELDTTIANGGANFSLGQRQIIALARAMVRRSKVYLLDEATASVDYKTDTAIQEVIASEFDDVTLIIVAHRLQTIMTADKVLVLDAGRVVEFDTPQALLERDGTFKALVDGSGDKELLYNMAKREG